MRRFIYTALLLLFHWAANAQNGTDAKPVNSSEADKMIALGKTALDNFELAEAGKQFTAALHYLSAQKLSNKELLYEASEGMGMVKWYASNLDSAEIYFNKAMQACMGAPTKPINQLYRRAYLENALSGVYSAEGKSGIAITTLQDGLTHVQQYLNTLPDTVMQKKANDLLFRATDNLAGFYKSLGNFTKTRDLLEYSYRQKKAKLPSTASGIFISEILLGEVYLSLREFTKARELLETGLAKASAVPGKYNIWKGDAWYTLALLYDEIKEDAKAIPYYEKADSIYQVAFEGSYDYIYLDFLRNAALFYAENGYHEKAVATASRGYRYVVKTEASNSLLPFNHLLNLADVYYKAHDVSTAKRYLDEAIVLVNRRITESSSFLDSLQAEINKPRALLLQARIQQQQLQANDSTARKKILAQLRAALEILERRKAYLQDPENTSVMMAEQTELIQFMQVIEMELYKLTANMEYAAEALMLHESAIYNRIRGRLQMQDSIRYLDIPEALYKKEQLIRLGLANGLNKERNDAVNFAAYLKTQKEWDQYLADLRKNHPRYYRFRFAEIFRQSADLQSGIAENTTVVRYVYVQDQLMAFVMDRQSKKLIALDGKDVINLVNSLNKNWHDASKTGAALFSLYQKLWQPVAAEVKNKRVVIIPDGILFQLSFESFVTQKTNSFEAMQQHCLLQQYIFSYRYSLLLMDEAKQSFAGKGFVAFVPGFTDRQKALYTSRQKDTIRWDKTYLSLLPLPFTNALAAEMKKQWQGELFAEDGSTTASFRTHAGDHAIIHIGTHAESNNNKPAFSRLIFAKDTARFDDDNSLYLPEIYQCNLRSSLTVLTACESGLPGYEDGEGMISLAHAFQYAGSESILTALWKVDENATAKITGLFYEKLLKGFSKDEALQQAKLAYLKTATGRALSPRYWAGLVLLGETAPVEVPEKSEFWIWVFLAIILLYLIIFISS
jgi:CHAT domain-containing protein